MSKVAVVFWSGTGNTGIMATKVAEGVTEAGGEATILPADQFNAEMISMSRWKRNLSGENMDSYDAIAFGCPSMGAEQLEESEFEPMFMECEPKLKGKKIALFGSYGWGDGEWMRTWEETCIGDGAVMACDFVICQETPDEEAESECKNLGKALI